MLSKEITAIEFPVLDISLSNEASIIISLQSKQLYTKKRNLKKIFS